MICSIGRLLLLLLGLLDIARAFRQDGGCLFPTRWEGTWFQSGVRAPIVIEGARLSNKGTCLASEGDKFLVVDDKRVCYRCVVIHEKHANVLQYKENKIIYENILQYSNFPKSCPIEPKDYYVTNYKINIGSLASIVPPGEYKVNISVASKNEVGFRYTAFGRAVQNIIQGRKVVENNVMEIKIGEL